VAGSVSVSVVPVVDGGLGNSSYLLDLGDGQALAVDPPRDLRAVRAVARKAGLRVAFAADTHLHADFLSGAVQLAADDGATVLASAAGRRAFPHIALQDEDEVDLGGLRLRALATPGHTHEHLSFLLLDGQQPVGVFTGGSLLVGAAARTDLVSPEQTEPLAHAQYRSLQRLLTLPDATAVWPTHGAGSFCSAPPGADRVTTIGRERASNPLLAVGGEDAFVGALLGSLGSYPAYFDRLGELNRRGPGVLEADPALPALPPARVAQLLTDGAEMVDLRPVAEFAAGHVPGSLSIPLRDQFATWLGWLVPPERPVVLVRGAGQDARALDDAVWQSLKIGYEPIGELAGGFDAWVDDGRLSASTGLVSPAELDPAKALDIRQTSEFAAGHVPRAAHIELGALAATDVDLPELADGTVVMCGHGERAMSAASLLERRGVTGVSVLAGGPNDWAAAAGVRLEQQ